ncbi:MAG: 30S ribosome-binding factor RbfA [SAR202 cluster bacterium]|nr:30S ribosome-binding factor RbfA [SAR202 cluster bacterium]
MTTRRLERVNGLLQREISRAISLEVKDPRLSSMVSVLRVETSPDLKNARVFVSVMGDEQEKKRAMRALRSAAEYIRHATKENVELRSVPHMAFVLDETIEHAIKMNRLIDKTLSQRGKSGGGTPTVEQGELADGAPKDG